MLGKRIMEIVRNLDKQKKDIRAVLQDVYNQAIFYDQRISCGYE